MRWVGGIGLCFLLAMTTSAIAAPERILSANLCADQLLLELSPKQHILAVSDFAHDPSLSYSHVLAQHIPHIRGTAEEILSLRPDLALIGPAQISPAINAILQQHHIPTFEVSIPTNIHAIETQIRTLANVIGREEVGKKLLARMQSRLIQVKLRSKQLSFTPRILIYHQGGYTESSDSILAALLPYVGAEPYTSQTHVSLEQLTTDPPDLIVYPYVANTTPSIGDIPIHHPIFKDWKPEQFMPLDAALLMCNNHQIAEIAHRIMDRLEALEPPKPFIASTR
jgi:iron complex transport system substrate-binding protein